MKLNIKIGTRDSQLALWQAKLVQQKMDSFTTSEIVEIKSEGDIDLISPLYEMGVQGIFTKSLDIALLKKTIDVAVHSLKDVPTQLPQGLIIAAILPRANYHDWMVIKNPSIDLLAPLTIATSSLRRKAQWLHRYPNHTFESLRGNINKRLQKLNDNQQWSGALFAAAGIERIGLAVPHYMELDWMLPAPAQGAIAVVCRDDDTIAKDICDLLQDEKTSICVQAERLFLRELMGGCSMPIAALATIDENNNMNFKGNILTIDGKQKAEAEMNFNADEYSEAGKKLAALVFKNGGEEILKKIKA